MDDWQMISIQPDEQGGAFRVDISTQLGSEIDRLAYNLVNCYIWYQGIDKANYVQNA